MVMLVQDTADVGQPRPVTAAKHASSTAAQPFLSLAVLATACLIFCAPLLLPAVAQSPASDFDSHLVPYAAILRDFGSWQWNPAFGLGQPMLADPLTNLFNPLADALLLGLGPERGLGPLLFISLVLTALTTRQLCRDLGCREFAATYGGLAFTLSGFVAGHLFAGHLEFILSFPALPLAWLAGRKLGSDTASAIVFGAVAIALPALSGASYFAEYAAAILALVMAVRFVAARGVAARGSVIVGAGGALLLGLGLSSIHLLPMLSLLGHLTRMPISAAGSLSPPSALWSLLLPPWLLADKTIGAWLEGQPAPTVGWYELTTYVGPLVLAPLIGLPVAWRLGRCMAIIEATVLIVFGMLLLDARSPLLPGYWLLHTVPVTLALRVPARALGLLALAVAALSAVGLNAILETAKARVARRWQQLSVLAMGTLLPVSGFVFLALAHAAVPARTPSLAPMAPNFTHRVLISGEVSQLALVRQGAAILNNYYGWHLPPALNVTVLQEAASAAVLRPGADLTYNSMTLFPLPTWATAEQAVAPTDGTQIEVNESATPVAFLTNDPCSSLPCPVQQSVQVTHWGQTTAIRADANAGEMLIVSEASVPGWRLRIDGGAGQDLPATEQVLMVPAIPGSHRYTFRYETPHLALGALFSGSSIVLCLVLGAVRKLRWKPGAS